MKKSQLKIGESIAVLFIFFVLVILGIIFWSKYSQSSIAAMTDEESLTKAVKISQIVSYLPELQCSTQEVIKFNCFDTIKINKMAELFMAGQDASEQAAADKAKLHYFDTLSFSNITVVSIYPQKRSYNVYDKPYATDGSNSYRTTQVPIAIYDPINATYSFGYLDVRVYTTT